MTEHESVPPSSEPDAATATGTGRGGAAAAPPPPPQESASTGGAGGEEQRKAGGSPPPGNAPLDLGDGGDDQPPRSDSGT